MFAKINEQHKEQWTRSECNCFWLPLFEHNTGTGACSITRITADLIHSGEGHCEI